MRSGNLLIAFEPFRAINREHERKGDNDPDCENDNYVRDGHALAAMSAAAARILSVLNEGLRAHAAQRAITETVATPAPHTNLPVDHHKHELGATAGCG
jgi:hypothetical protein